MKKNFTVIASVILIVLTLGVLKSSAHQYQYPSVDKTLCAKYLLMASKAAKNNNLSLAKLFARKAVQADVFNMTAWKTYDSILIKMSHRNPAQVSTFNVSKPKKPAAPKASVPAAPSGGGAFEGC